MVYTDRYNSIPVYTASSPGVMTREEAYQQCIAVGFEPEAATIAVAIMIAESGLVSDVVNTTGNNPPSRDRGIAQINDYYHPNVSDECAFNTECAIKEMYRIASGGTDFTPWTTYNVGAFRKHLSTVQESTGVVGRIGVSAPTGGGGTSPTSNKKVATTRNYPRSLSAYFGTSDGRIFASEDSGRSWRQLINFGDGFPILAIRSSPNLDGVWAFGGDTSQPDTLIRVASRMPNDFVSVPIQGELRRQCIANPGFPIREAAFNRRGCTIAFGGGVTPLVWFNTDPVSGQEWTPVTGITGTVDGMAPGNDAEVVAAGSLGSFNTQDSAAYTPAGTTPSTIRDMIWEGMEGSYLAAADYELLKTVDLGAGWGQLRPNGDLGTTWPSGAVGRKLSSTIGPRNVSYGTHDGTPDTGASPWISPSPSIFSNGGAAIGDATNLFQAMQPYQFALFLVENPWDPETLILSATNLTFQFIAKGDRGGGFSTDRWVGLLGVWCTGPSPTVTFNAPNDLNIFIRGIVTGPADISGGGPIREQNFQVTGPVTDINLSLGATEREMILTCTDATQFATVSNQIALNAGAFVCYMYEGTGDQSWASGVLGAHPVCITGGVVVRPKP